MYAWMREALRDGAEILAVILESSAVWNRAEREWITKLREDGYQLINVKRGGNGSAQSSNTVFFVDDAPLQAAYDIATRYQDGETRHELAKSFQCSIPTVRSVLKRMGVKLRDGGTPKRAVTVNGRSYSDVKSAMKGEKVGYKELMRLVNGEPKPPKVAKQITAEHAQKISEAAKKRWANPEFKDRTVASIRAVAQTPEWRQKCRESALNQMADPEMRERIAAKNRDRLSDPAEREKIAERTRQQWADPVERETILAGLRSQGPRKKT